MLAGCATTVTNLTPHQRTRSTNNLYQVEVALQSRQQTMRWESIRPEIVLDGKAYPMRPTPLMANRWEGMLPVSADKNLVHYRYLFNYDYNAFGKPKSDSMLSPEYTLQIFNPQP